MSQDQYKAVLGKIGMKPRGGSLTKIPCCDPVGSEHKGSAAWACPGMGLFILDHADKQAVDLDAIVARDLLVCAVALNDASTGFAVGKRRLDVEGSDMIMIFVPRGERFHFATTVERGLKGVTIVVDLESMRTLGLPIARLPKSLFEIIQRREIVIEALAPGHFGTVAADIIARRGLFPSLARPYYNGKALELFSTLLNQISQRDAVRAEGGAIDPGMLARLRTVKRFIEQGQHRTLDVDGLERMARMNRTKLRATFKQAFGMTISDYRTALMLRRGDRALKEAGSTVQEAAHQAGYGSASSFIVAYKRHYGVRPGNVRR